jgi:hypothetical protein
MPDNPSTNHPRLFFEFVRAVFSHWVAYVSGGVLAVGLGWLQGIGKIDSRPWQYWSIATLGLLVSIYQAWADERLRVEALEKQLDDKNEKRKQELIRIVTVLHDFEEKVAYWLVVTSGNYSKALTPVKIVPDELPSILFEAEKIKPDSRTIMEMVKKKAAEAEALITVYFQEDITFRNERFMKQAYQLLNEAAPLLSNVVVAIDAFEKRFSAETG